MRPSGTRAISGAISAGSPLVDLNGADNVTIDGLGTGGNSLTFSNTTVSNLRGTGTIRFINGAQNNTVTRCAVLGSANPAALSIAGNIVFGGTTAGSGNNNNNTVSFCNLGPAGTSLPTKPIVAFAPVATPNTGNLITNNNIFDFFSATLPASGISILDNNDNWTISNNRFFQTEPRTFTATAQRYSGITIKTTNVSPFIGSFTITGNVGAGLAVVGITDDFDGNPRQNPPAIGVGEPSVIATPTPVPTARPTPMPRHTPISRPQPTPPSHPTPEAAPADSEKISTHPRVIASPAGAKKK